MENKIRGVLIIGLGITFLGGLILMFASHLDTKLFPKMDKVSESQSQNSSVEENKGKEFKQYSFCKNSYRAVPVMLNGMDIIQEIAEISSGDKIHRICENLNTNIKTDKVLTVEIKQYPEDVDYKSSEHYVTIDSLRFKVDTFTQNVYILSAFDGSQKLIGSLKK